MTVPAEIVDSVRKGECILFLGAMASAPSPANCEYQYVKGPPSGGELSRRLAERFGYPGDDVNNLQRVSLYAEYRQGGSRKALVDALADEIARPAESVSDRVEIEPSPALHMLAALPFRIVITTNYDRLLEKAYREARTTAGRRKEPIVSIYDPTRNTAPEEVPIDAIDEQPVLLKLHGDIQKPESIVITEEDYITFIQRMADAHLHPIHEYIRVRMRAWRFLFVGYSLKDYNLRLLFRTLRWGMDVSRYPLSYSVDPHPDNLIVSVWQRSSPPTVFFIEEDLWTFVPALYQAVLGKEYRP